MQKFALESRENLVEYQLPANSFDVLLLNCSFDDSAIVAAMSVQFVSDVDGRSG